MATATGRGFPRRARTNMRSGCWRHLWIGCLDTNITQIFAAVVELALTGRKAVGPQDECQDVSVLFAAQAARIIQRHGRADTIEQISEVKAVEIGNELRTDECRSLGYSAEGSAVTGCAMLCKLLGASMRLGLGVNPIAHRSRRFLGRQRAARRHH